MARRLTKKQQGFIKDYVTTGNGVKSAMNNYDTEDYNTANVIAVENLQKPTIIAALAELGFSETGAKKVVEEIMYNPKTDASARLKATDQVFKVHGSYAAEKVQTLNVNLEGKMENSEAESLRLEFEEKLKAKFIS